MRQSRVRSLIGAGTTVVNGWLSSDSAYFAEALSHAGFDAVTVDLQHGMYGLDTAVRLIQAVSAGPAEPMARCPSHDPAVIGKLLDAGAYGIICPAVDSPEQAAAFVAACRYPPTGSRSYGPARAALYGGPGYVEQADDVVMAWAMVESRAALDAVEDIAGVPGLDGLYVGPNDLAMSLGVQVGVPTPELEAAWRRIADAAHAAGIAAGTFCADGVLAAKLAGLGYDLVTPGNDAMLLRAAAQAAVSAARGAAADPSGSGASASSAGTGY